MTAPACPVGTGGRRALAWCRPWPARLSCHRRSGFGMRLRRTWRGSRVSRGCIPSRICAGTSSGVDPGDSIRLRRAGCTSNWFCDGCKRWLARVPAEAKSSQVCRLPASTIRAWVYCDCVGRLGRAVADPRHRGSGHQCANDSSAGPSPGYGSAGGRSPRASAAARWRSISRTSGSACRCTSRQSSPSRRNSIVTRNDQS